MHGQDSQPKCPVCGGTDYCVEAGFYYCMECQTQSQEIREEVFEGWTAEKNIESSHSAANKRRRKVPEPDREWTTWEAYNWILKGLVDEVVALGAKSSVKAIVLQLWASYLKKMGIAFTSKETQEMPKLAVDFDAQDASLVCGIKVKSETSSRKSSSCKSACSVSSKSTVSTTYSSSYQERRRELMKKRRKLMIVEAERVQQDTEATLDFSSQLEQSLRERESSAETTISVTCPSKNRGFRSKNCQKERRKLLKKLCGLRGMYKGWKSAGNSLHHRSADPTILSRFRLLNFVHLSLLIDGSDIQLSDLLRWIREGHLSFQHMTHFFPDDVCIKKSDRWLFGQVMPVPQHSTILQGTALLADWLGVTYIPVPDVHQLIQRQIRELGLPEGMTVLVEQLTDFIPVLPFVKENKYFCSYEIQTMAMIIFLLKLLLGLDDRTEHRNSKTTKRLNELHGEKCYWLFDWNDWICWFENRKKLLIQHNIPLRDLIDPREAVNTDQLIGQWKSVFKEENIGGKLKPGDHYYKSLSSKTCQNLKEPLLLLTQKRFETTCVTHFPATLTPLSTYSSIITTSVGNDLKNSHWKDFSTSDVNFMLDPTKVQQFAKINKIKLKILKHSACKNFKRLPSFQTGSQHCRNVTISIVPIEKENTHWKSRWNTNSVYSNSDVLKKISLHNSGSNVYLKHTHHLKKFPDGKYESHSVDTKRKRKVHKTFKKCQRKKKRKHISNTGSTGCEDFAEPQLQMENRFQLKSEEFLNFHMGIISEQHGVIRKPTTVEKGEVGLVTCSEKQYIKDIKKKLLEGVSYTDRECLKLYLPYRYYWMCKGPFEKRLQRISDQKFDTVLRKLPMSFNWILQECAQILEVEKRFLYCELLRVERMALCVDYSC